MFLGVKLTASAANPEPPNKLALYIMLLFGSTVINKGHKVLVVSILHEEGIDVKLLFNSFRVVEVHPVLLDVLDPFRPSVVFLFKLV